MGVVELSFLRRLLLLLLASRGNTMRDLCHKQCITLNEHISDSKVLLNEALQFSINTVTIFPGCAEV